MMTKDEVRLTIARNRRWLELPLTRDAEELHAAKDRWLRAELLAIGVLLALLGVGAFAFLA